MLNGEHNILAINPGARYIGLAVFHGPELLDWNVKRVQEENVEERLRRVNSILSEVIKMYDFDCLAIKELHQSRTSEYICKLTKELKSWAQRNGLAVHEYTLKDIEISLLHSAKANKRNIMDEVADVYSFLHSEVEKERANRNGYLVRMFEAVALGMKCLNDLEKPKGRKIISVNHGKEKQ